MKKCNNLAKRNPKRPGIKVGKVLGKVGVFGFVAFVSTFTIFMFNLENKLIYYVVRPFLNKHYDNQKRDRRIV